MFYFLSLQVRCDTQDTALSWADASRSNTFPLSEAPDLSAGSGMVFGDFASADVVSSSGSSPMLPTGKSGAVNKNSTAAAVTGVGFGLRKCPYCQYETPCFSTMAKHLKTHSADRPFACPFCAFRSNQRCNLIRHIRRHTGEKPFACIYCSYSTTRKSILDKHIDRKHADVHYAKADSVAAAAAAAANANADAAANANAAAAIANAEAVAFVGAVDLNE